MGEVYQHPYGRTISHTDNLWMSLLSQNQGALHIDANASKSSGFGGTLVDATFTLAVLTGQSVGDLSRNVHANLGWDKVRCPNPVREGDTLYSRSEVLEARPSNSHPELGVLRVRTVGFNQNGVIVMTFERVLLVKRRPADTTDPAGPDGGVSAQAFDPSRIELQWDPRSRRALEE